MRFLPLTLLLLSISTATADDAAELAASLPDSANTLSVVRVSSILGTDRALDEHWYERQEEKYQSGVAVIPPWVDTLVVGSLVHPSVPEEVWSAAVVRRPENITLEAIAEQAGGSIEDLGGSPAVRTQRDSYLAQPLPDLFTAYRPAHRLDAARWARAVKEGATSRVSPYLQQAAAADGHVVLAMDLRDVLDSAMVERHLREDERFASHRQLVNRLIPLISGIKGVTFSATIGEETEATITIDFSEDIGPSALSIKTLFVSVLDDLGAAISELEETKAFGTDQTVTMKCTLSDDSLRRILSLIVTPSAPYQVAAQPAKESSKPSTRASRTRTANPEQATERYVASVNNMIDHLKRANRNANDYAKTATWHETFAQKILDLPTDGVKEFAVNYGDRIASSFRALAASLRGQSVQVNAQQRTLTYDVDYQPGWASVNVWGGVGYRDPAYNVSSNLQQVREQQAAAVMKGSDDRLQIWQMIEDERAAVTRRMQE
ncbi:MAG: hypothetical protein KDA93_16625 [Planctomycetaceae bacterium]|nr:hypothetical protein [Planctomycetaceae bacterium]